MSKINTYSRLIKELKSRINSALNDDSGGGVFDTVRKCEQKHIDSDVYGFYDPTIYARRDTSGGLIDDASFVKEVDDTTISIENISEPSKSLFGQSYNSHGTTEFADWIESGKVPNIFNSRTDYPWGKPRKFTENTINDLKENKQHVSAIKNTLSKNGVKTK